MPTARSSSPRWSEELELDRWLRDRGIVSPQSHHHSGPLGPQNSLPPEGSSPISTVMPCLAQLRVDLDHTPANPGQGIPTYPGGAATASG
ncbi:MAG: hypothetical protein SNJ85_02545 [Cyanobacteriota bacterium]